MKSLSPTDKIGKDKQNNARITCVRKPEFLKQRIVSRSGTEKETKNVIAKPNLAKMGVQTIDICQNKNRTLNRTVQKQQQTMSKQCTTKLKDQESLKKNVSNSSDDKNKMEKAMHMPDNVDSPSNESEKKNEKIVNENVQSDQKPNRSINFRKNTTFVAQYKNSTFSKSTQNIPRTGQSSMYGRNSYAYNNPKFDRNRNSPDCRITKKESSPIDTCAKSNTKTKELHTNNLENCAKQKKEIIQPTNAKSTCEGDTLVVNDKKDINPAKLETPLVQSKEETDSNIDQESTSEQHCVEINISKIDIDQQHKKTNNEETASLKQPSDLPSDRYATNSQPNVINQYSLKLENTQRTSDLSQLESGQITWNQSDVTQKDVIRDLQQSIQNMHFNTQQILTPAENPTRQMSSWEPNNSKFYDQHFSVSNGTRLSQIPDIFNVPPFEYSASTSSDNVIANVTATSTLETTSINRENSNVQLYKYGSQNVRPVVTSDFPGHSMSPSQANHARWNSSVDSFHVEHPYVTTQPTMMHVYDPAVFGADDFNVHTMDYVSPVIYAPPPPYMQTWNSQLQYPMPVLYNSPCATFAHDHQPNDFNNSMHDQQHKHNPYAQMNNYVRDTCNDTNTFAVHCARNAGDNVPIKSNYYYKKHQDSCRATYDVPQYVPPISYSRSQQDVHFMPAQDTSQYVPYYPPSQRPCRQSVANCMKSPMHQMQDFTCDDGSEDSPPIICPKEFVTNDINLLNKTNTNATRVFRPEFKRSNSGYRPPSSYARYSGGFYRNTTVQNIPRDTYPVSIGRGTYKTKKI